MSHHEHPGYRLLLGTLTTQPFEALFSSGCGCGVGAVCVSVCLFSKWE